jgi:dolichol-phosphate mannosyltransferase
MPEIGTGPVLSVIVPCYNEQDCIEETYRRLTEVARRVVPSYELVFVNDGSKDETLNVLLAIAENDSRVRVISFSRNFGHQIAVTAGIDHADGEAIVLIDADLQDPPELIEEMLAKWRAGYQVVFAQRTARAGETGFKRLTAHYFYRILNKLSEVEIPTDTGDFRLMDRRVVEVLRQMPERGRFIRGMVSWVGFKQIGVQYERAERFAGESKYPLKKMIKFAMDGVLSFSTAPLRLAMSVGAWCSGLALLGIIYAVCVRLFTTHYENGWAFLICSILGVGGVQLICLGILGEYLGRMYTQVKGRPLYVVAYDNFPVVGEIDRLPGSAAPITRQSPGLGPA